MYTLLYAVFLERWELRIGEFHIVWNLSDVYVISEMSDSVVLGEVAGGLPLKVV